MTQIEIDESECRRSNSVPELSGGTDALVLTNRTKEVIDGEQLAKWLAKAPGVGAITSLMIAPSSRLQDLSVVAGLPKLKDLHVNGGRIESLRGVHEFRNVKYLSVDTGSNRRRDVSALADAPAEKRSLQCVHKRDLDALAGNRTIRHLILGACWQPPFDSWRDLPISTLSISNGVFSELANTSAVTSLRELVLTKCRELEVCAGDNSNLT